MGGYFKPPPDGYDLTFPGTEQVRSTAKGKVNTSREGMSRVEMPLPRILLFPDELMVCRTFAICDVGLIPPEIHPPPPFQKREWSPKLSACC